MAIGLWFVGARGSLATTVTCGLSLLKDGAAPTHGLVSELDEFTGVDFPPFADFVIGGHDVSSTPMIKRAEQLMQAGVLPAVSTLVEDAVTAADSQVRSGVDGTGVDGGGLNAVRRIAGDLIAFRDDHDLQSVIVVNVSSTEPTPAANVAFGSLDALAGNEDLLPPSSLYAYAALDSGFPYIDFTPSLGASIPALDELAKLRGVPYAGRDGKTGETLVKTALVPMFTNRNLHITSWAGLNLLGGGDGRSLSDPQRKQSKLQSKARSLRDSLGYEVDSPVGIEYIEDMDEWKTAWNQVRFQGFMGTAMTLQFTWQGCDSALAAPLVIDLARFTFAAQNAGLSGALADLAFFFKDPLGTDEHRLNKQFDRLVAWANALQQQA